MCITKQVDEGSPRRGDHEEAAAGRQSRRYHARSSTNTIECLHTETNTFAQTKVQDLSKICRNNDQRKEKAKNAARERRTQEGDYFDVSQ